MKRSCLHWSCREPVVEQEFFCNQHLEGMRMGGEGIPEHMEISHQRAVTHQLVALNQRLATDLKHQGLRMQQLQVLLHDRLDGQYPHYYYSTYCIHHEHRDCRRKCKHCEELCLCQCHNSEEAGT